MSFHGETDSRHGVTRTVGSLLVALIALFLFAATFRTGIQYGMDRKVGWEAWGRVVQATAAVMTDERYGEGGYALSNIIFSDLNSRGFTGVPATVEKFGLKVPENLQASFLDGVLQRMWQDLPTFSDFGRTAMRGLGADDIGYVDYVRIAFSMFGIHVRSFYYLFFVIYGISLLLALVERAHDRVGQGIILATAAVVFASCYYADFLLTPEPLGSGNMMNPRFIGVLGLIPTVHILLATVEGVRLRLSKIALLLPQAGFVFFAVHLRATAVWLVATLALAVLILSLPRIREAIKDRVSPRRLLGRFLIARWPAVMALVIVLGGLEAVTLSLHPAYREGGWLQHHAMWHSIYYSLQYHPDFVKKYGAAHYDMKGDAMPIGAALAYVKGHPEEEKPGIYLVPGHLKYAEMERLVKLAFFEFFRKDPLFVIQAFVIKSKLLSEIMIREMRLAWGNAAPWQRFAFACGVFAIGVLASLSSAAFRRLWLFSVVFGVGAVASLSIPVLTVVAPQVISEEFMAMVVLILMGVAVLVAMACRFLMRISLNNPGALAYAGWRARLSPSSPPNPIS